eukprot:4123-Heterococcus_DN1.PRE.1
MTHYTHSLTGKLPNGLKTLIVNALLHSLGTLPSCLEQLYYSNCTAALPALPRTLRKLYISSSRFNAPLGKLPVTLTELDLGTATAFKQQLEALPVALKTLTLHAEYQQPLLQLATTTKVIGVRLHADQRTTVQRTRMILPRGIAVLTQAAADEQLELREALILAQQMQDVVAIEQQAVYCEQDMYADHDGITKTWNLEKFNSAIDDSLCSVDCYYANIGVLSAVMYDD